MQHQETIELTIDADLFARRAFKGVAISTPLQLVNLYCAVSVQHLAPLGAYDWGDFRQRPRSHCDTVVHVRQILADRRPSRRLPLV